MRVWGDSEESEATFMSVFEVLGFPELRNRSVLPKARFLVLLKDLLGMISSFLQDKTTCLRVLPHLQINLFLQSMVLDWTRGLKGA